MNRIMELPLPYPSLLNRLTDACRAHYGHRLVTVAVFGSVGRGTQNPESDIDLLIIARQLPQGRIARVQDFSKIEQEMRQEFSFPFELSPVFKTPEEVQRGSPLFLDMVEDALLLYDEEAFFENFLRELRQRLGKLGAKRIWVGNAWYWDLKPDYQPGEIFEI